MKKDKPLKLEDLKEGDWVFSIDRFLRTGVVGLEYVKIIYQIVGKQDNSWQKRIGEKLWARAYLERGEFIDKTSFNPDDKREHLFKLNENEIMEIKKKLMLMELEWN